MVRQGRAWQDRAGQGMVLLDRVKCRAVLGREGKGWAGQGRAVQG